MKDTETARATEQGSRAKPPFRADHVGSLLRPRTVAEAKFLPPEERRAVEDAAIRGLVKMQEDVGLKVVTDGEARRDYWHFDFFRALKGVEFTAGDNPKFANGNAPEDTPAITGALGFPADHPMLADYRFLAENTKVFPKISIPGPSVLHIGITDELNHHAPYREDREVLLAAMAQTWKQAVAAFYDAGCRYLQIDDIIFAFLGDPAHQKRLKETRGLDAEWLVDRYAWMLNEAIRDRPEDMVIGMHMCRGNFQSSHAAEGGYDISADAIFNRTDVDIYLMEYDTERAGGLEPLRLLPKGKKRVMTGFITTKSPELEDEDWLWRKYDEASKYADMDQLGISPQCGFASTHHGNHVSEDDQRRKLELVVRTAEKIWGEA